MQQLRKQFVVENVNTELIRTYLYKFVYQRFIMPKPSAKRILCIWGCQRSGTSLMTRIFFRDFTAKVYREASKLSSADARGLRLNTFAHLKKVFAKDKASLIVLKPLVESQNALQFLKDFPETRGLWLYRHYKDVAISNLQAFGMNNGIADLRPIVENQSGNWRNEGISPATRAIIATHFAEDMNPYAAAALFWFARNQLFFELNLEANCKVALCQYEDMVTHPKKSLQKIYEFIERPYPGDHILVEVHARSVKRGKTITLAQEITELCDNLQAKLETVYQSHRQEGFKQTVQTEYSAAPFPC